MSDGARPLSSGLFAFSARAQDAQHELNALSEGLRARSLSLRADAGRHQRILSHLSRWSLNDVTTWGHRP